jgi:hypothetical protein
MRYAQGSTEYECNCSFEAKQGLLCLQLPKKVGCLALEGARIMPGLSAAGWFPSGARIGLRSERVVVAAFLRFLFPCATK